MRVLKLSFSIIVAILITFSSSEGYSTDHKDELPGVIAPSACRVGAVISTEQFLPAAPFMGPGRSTLLPGLPGEELVVGKWVIVNNFVPDFSNISAPNCNGAAGPVGVASDGAGLNLMALRIRTTISSPQDADIQSITLVWDINANGVYEPLQDLVLDKKPGSELLKPGGILFHYGPQQPIAVLNNSPGVCNSVGLPNIPVTNGAGPVDGTNGRFPPFGTDGCYFAVLAVAEIGDSPKHRTRFGLDLKAYSGDIPGTSGISSYSFSSGFSSSRNPQASNTTVDIYGGLPGTASAPTRTIYDTATNPENIFTELNFTGGANGEGLLSRFRADTIGPGTREAIIFAGALCDGGPSAVTDVPILPPIAGSNPQIAGGLGSVPCIPAPFTDGIAAGIIAATLIFDIADEFYDLIGTTRMYADTDCDGIFFEAGELIESQVPFYNEPTRDIYAFFNRKQAGPMQVPTTGALLAGGCAAVGAPAGADASPLPLILIWTVDINNDVPVGPPVSAASFGSRDFVVRAQNNHFGLNGNVQITGTTPTSNGGSSECEQSCESSCEGNESCIASCLCFVCDFEEFCEEMEPDSIETDDISVTAMSLYNSVMFKVSCQKLAFSELEIYDLKGRNVYKSHHQPSDRVLWKLTDSNNQPIANGIYLYVVKVHRSDGEVIASNVKKIAVVR